MRRAAGLVAAAGGCLLLLAVALSQGAAGPVEELGTYIDPRCTYLPRSVCAGPGFRHGDKLGVGMAGFIARQERQWKRPVGAVQATGHSETVTYTRSGPPWVPESILKAFANDGGDAQPLRMKRRVVVHDQHESGHWVRVPGHRVTVQRFQAPPTVAVQSRHGSRRIVVSPVHIGTEEVHLGGGGRVVVAHGGVPSPVVVARGGVPPPAVAVAQAGFAMSTGGAPQPVAVARAGALPAGVMGVRRVRVMPPKVAVENVVSEVDQNLKMQEAVDEAKLVQARANLAEFHSFLQMKSGTPRVVRAVLPTYDTMRTSHRALVPSYAPMPTARPPAFVPSYEPMRSVRSAFAPSYEPMPTSRRYEPIPTSRRYEPMPPSRPALEASYNTVATYDAMRPARTAVALSSPAMPAWQAAPHFDNPAVQVSPIAQMGEAATRVSAARVAVGMPNAAVLSSEVSSSLRPLSLSGGAVTVTRRGRDWKDTVRPTLRPLWYAGLNQGALTQPLHRRVARVVHGGAGAVLAPGPGWGEVMGSTPVMMGAAPMAAHRMVRVEPSWAAAERTARSVVSSNAASAEWHAGGATTSSAALPSEAPEVSPEAAAAGNAAAQAAVAARSARDGGEAKVQGGPGFGTLTPLKIASNHGGVFAASGDR
ncbi:hypothetical protein T484DRAFT_1848550, partial [Baffinella frigidus]